MAPGFGNQCGRDGEVLDFAGGKDSPSFTVNQFAPKRDGSKVDIIWGRPHSMHLSRLPEEKPATANPAETTEDRARARAGVKKTVDV